MKMNNQHCTDYDVGIIGGGPAGSALAGYLAKRGIRCIVLERELFPRPHVGESLVPAANRVLAELGCLHKMEEGRFPHKLGAVWTTAMSTHFHDVDWQGLDVANSSIRFDERELANVKQSYTYHVDRAAFDLMLLQHAHELGAEVYEGVTVRGVDFADTHAEIRFKIANRETRTRVKMVADATGRQTLLGTQLKLKRRDPVFDQFAIHAWFDGYDRTRFAADSKHADYIFIHFLPMTNTWVWQIPITDTITSVGVVTQKKNFATSRSARENFFWDCVATQPTLERGLRDACQVRPLKDEGDYSYAMGCFSGDRFVLLGDAARFVDPIFSSGVSIAMNSARLAADDIVQAVGSGHFARSAFSTFESTLTRGTRNWHSFISVYYRLNVLFTYFIQQPRYRLDVLKLLQGDVYDEREPDVLAEMREMVSGIEGNPSHPWHKLLNDLTNAAFVHTP